MCGIVGFIDRSASPADASAQLGEMLAVIHHRGPDGEGSYIDPEARLAIGMRRLSIIDLEGGKQPVWNETGTVAVVFNGEIYNYVELRAQLVTAGHVFRTQSDTEVLVHGYEQFGTGLLDRLRGMFGLAIYDTEKKQILLARDHFGQKPLYYCEQGERFAFASEIKSLLTLPWIPREVDHESFLDFASWLSLPAPKTHFRHIHKVPPGTWLEISLDSPGIAQQTRFWQYEPNRNPDLIEMDIAASELDAALQDSIRLHLRADVPVGVLLSSGLDSRCVAAYTQEFKGGSLKTFSVGFSDGTSELEGALRTSRDLKTQHYAMTLGPHDLLESIERVAWHLDEPVGDPAAFAVMKVCELARPHVKVVLGGEGSDELFAGYAGRYGGAIETIQRTDRFRRFGSLLSPAARLLRSTRLQRLGGRVRLSRGSELLALRMEGLPANNLRPYGLCAWQLERLRYRQSELSRRLFDENFDLLAAATALDFKWQLAESLLLKADKMSMAASIEMRSPFLDVEVAKVAARIHSNLKLPPGNRHGKLVLRHCMAKKFGDSVDRPKLGFPVPLTKWLTGPLRGAVEDRLFSQDSVLSTLLERRLLEVAWRDFVAGAAELAYSFYALWLYCVWYDQIQKACTPRSAGAPY